MNIVHIAGHLGADPEVRFTSGGQKVSTLRVAAKARKAGNDETIWWRVTIWGDQFDKILKFFKKGSAIIVVGNMSKPDIFNDREGKPQVSMDLTATNILFPPFGRSSGGAQAAAPAKGKEEDFAGFTSGEAPSGGTAAEEIQDDEIPF